MYIHTCPQCGLQYSTTEQVARVKCPYCGHETNVSYAEQQSGPNQWQQSGSQAAGAADSVFSNGPSGKSRGVAGLMALLLGCFGLHYFYLGKTGAGITFLLITILSCFILGSLVQVVAVIQGVLFFTMTSDEFERKWVNAANTFPLF